MILFITMKKYNKKVIITFLSIFVFVTTSLHAFDKGFIWGLKANFFGAITMPSINDADLDKMGAAFMKGGMGFHVDGEADLGYIFKLRSSGFNGISIYGSLGIGTGGVNEIAGNTIGGNTVNMYVDISYMPVLAFGGGAKAYFFDSRLSAGLWLGTKMIMDMSPAYLAYSDDATVLKPEVGEVIVDNWMMQNMNPFSFSMRACFEYHQPINNYVRMTLGIFGRFNIYSPKYITMPDSLLALMRTVRPDFDVREPLKSFFLNSFDFGVTLGLTFRGSRYKPIEETVQNY